MQVTTVTKDLLSAHDTVLCRLAFTEVTLHPFVASNTDWPCHNYTEDIDRRVVFQQKLINIEEHENILHCFEAEPVLSKLLRHS